MVRLKAELRWSADGYYGISIPYGSIKRNKQSNNKKINKISIPYGSIKSGYMDSATYVVHGFQFLMVRLKVC